MKTSALYQQYGLDMDTNMNVNVDLPSELQVNIPPTSYPVNEQTLESSPSMKLNNTSPSMSTHNMITPLKHTPEPPYSNLKGSTIKPTFRQWNKTRKNRSHFSSAGANSDKEKSTHAKLNERERRLEMIKNKFQDTSKNLSSSGSEILELKKFYTKSKSGGKSRSRRKQSKKP